VHGVGGEARGFEQRLVNGIVREDFAEGVERLLELPANEIEHASSRIRDVMWGSWSKKFGQHS
jgi:hypothetical protein